MKREVEVLVVGAGAVGICAAHYLAQDGRQVAVVEKGEVCSGSSYGNAGLIVPSHSVPLAAPGMVYRALKWMFDPESPFHIKPRFDPGLFSWLWEFRANCNKRHVRRSMPLIRDLSLASLRLFEDLASQDGLDFGFEQRGILMVCNTEAGLTQYSAEARLLQERGVGAEVLGPAQVLELEPSIRRDILGGVFYPRDAHLDPARFVRELARHAEQQGVEIHSSTEVLGLRAEGGRVVSVETTRGEFAARHVVLAGGAWSPEVARDLGIRLPIQPAKGYSITFQRPASGPSLPLMLAGSRIGVTPVGDILRFAGTLELAGMDLSVNQRRVRAILKAVPGYFAELDPADLELIEIWRGLRPCTPDGLPFLGRCRAYENLTVAAGHAMIGMSLGPITGRLVAQLVAGEEPEFDLSLLGVERFG